MDIKEAKKAIKAACIAGIVASGLSFVAAAIIHGSLNATYGLSLMVIKGGNDLAVGVTGLAGFIVLAFVNIGFLLYDHLFTKEPIMVG